LHKRQQTGYSVNSLKILYRFPGYVSTPTFTELLATRRFHEWWRRLGPRAVAASQLRRWLSSGIFGGTSSEELLHSGIAGCIGLHSRFGGFRTATLKLRARGM
jgi:hypothetical protein